MTDKQQIVYKDKQFRELHQFLNDLCDKKVVKICGTIPLAEALYNAGYRRVGESAVVVDKEYLKKELQGLELQARKETADKIFDILYQWLDLEQIEKYGFVTIQKFDFLRKFREIFKQFGVEVEE